MPIFSQLVDVLAQTLMIYSVFLLIRVLLSWFPNLDWGSNPILSGLSSITDPYLNLFRGLIPPLGGIDLSALVAFLALNLVQSLLEQGKMLLASSGMG
jgi:YggT family protein